MSPQSIVCATCDATVPYGRLSCPACGELLASVAGAARPVKARAASARAASARAAAGRATGRAVPAVLVDVPPPFEAAAAPAAADVAHESADAAPESAGTGSLDWDPPEWDAPKPKDDGSADETLEPPAAASDAPVSEPAAPAWEPPIFQSVAGPAVATTVDAEAAADVDEDAAGGVAAGAAGSSSTVAWPGDLVRPDSPPARAAVPIPSVPGAPGAYVPPIVPAEPAGPPAPARAWAGQSNGGTAASKADAPRTSAAADLLDATRVTEFVGWLAVAGSAMAAVGFLLPWGVSVIGASGVGYFDRWGLAGPFHLIVFGSLLALLGLSLVRNPIPLWLRVGVLGLGLGALLEGLIWPYLVGLSGTGPGAMVVAIGALVLGAAGVGALAADRHAPEDRAV